jgi:uncharacterized repeat protein (TIGR03809 family)
MTMESQSFRRFSETARKWRELVDRRSAHLVELHLSGRWRHYYEEGEFLLLLREALDLAETWAQMAPVLQQDSGDEFAPAGPGTPQARRTAA